MGLMDFESRKSMDHPAPLASPINNDPCVAHWCWVYQQPQTTRSYGTASSQILLRILFPDAEAF